MSKEKLQELYTLCIGKCYYEDDFGVKDIVKIAYNQALEDANEVVFYEGLDFIRSEDYNQKSEHRFSDTQQSILKLKL